MKTSASAFIFALFATTVVGRNCKPGLDYCGHTLRNIGKYDSQIAQAMQDAGKGGQDGTNALFHCIGGDNGVIKFKKFCTVDCKDNGNGKSDTCGN